MLNKSTIVEDKSRSQLSFITCVGMAIYRKSSWWNRLADMGSTKLQLRMALQQILNKQKIPDICS